MDIASVEEQRPLPHVQRPEQPQTSQSENQDAKDMPVRNAVPMCFSGRDRGILKKSKRFRCDMGKREVSLGG
jgi:hypothetical protein